MRNDLNNTISKSFYMMFFGLLISGITAWFTNNTNVLETILTNNSFNMLLLLELGVVILFSWYFHKVSPNTVKLLYFIYAMMNGLTLSVIFAVFELNFLVSLFLLSSLGFSILAYIDKIPNKYLTKFETFYQYS